MYSGSVTYDKTTLKTLGSVQNSANILHNVLYLLMCVILIIAGVLFGIRSTPGIVCVAIGCIGIPLLNATNKAATGKMIEALNGQSIYVAYSFYAGNFTCTTKEKHTSFSYDQLKKLWEDDQYLYIFPFKNQAFMISKASITNGQPEDFKKFLTEKTGLQWNSSRSILLTRLNLFKRK